MSVTAHEHYLRQCKYDQLHHRMRLEWLESLPRLDHFQASLLKQSQEIIARPCLGFNSVDLEDAAYRAELDQWAKSQSTLIQGA